MEKNEGLSEADFKVVDKLLMDVLDPADYSLGLAEKFCEEYEIPVEERDGELARLNELFDPEGVNRDDKTRAREVLEKDDGELVDLFKGVGDSKEGAIVKKGYYDSNDIDSLVDKVVLLVKKIEKEYGERGES